jgi:hypothetical protein
MKIESDCSIRAPYWVPFYFNMVEAHLLVSWLSRSGLELFSLMLHQELWSYVFLELMRQVLETIVFLAWMDLFL